jgi:acyl-CoA synthetase (NDP forming)
VAAVALAIDLVHELDGDQSYPLALRDAAEHTDKPVAVLSNLGSAIDLDVACQLRDGGIAVLEGTRSGLLALGHLLKHADRRDYEGNVRRPADSPAPGETQSRGAELLAGGAASGAPLLALLNDYGIAVPRTGQVSSAAEAVEAAAAIGYPVVLKTDEPAILHKSDAGGVLLGLNDSAAVQAGYADLAARLGPRVLICQTVPAGIELALGIARDPELGPMIVVGAGGILVELIGDRAVALPPVGPELARELVGELKVAKLLAGVRGAPPADLAAVIAAITGLSQLAADLGDQLEALDINPLICGPTGAIAVDALAVPRTAS